MSVDDRGELGGRCVALTGDGHGMVIAEQLDSETVYAVRFDAAQTLALLRRACEADILALPSSAPGDDVVTITLLAHEAAREVRQSLATADAGFVAVYEAVGAALDALPAEQARVLLTDALEPNSDPVAVQELLEHMASAMTELGWRYSRTETDLRLMFKGDDGVFQMVAHPRIVGDAQRVLCYTLPDFTAPPEQLGAVMEFVTRANFGMVLGNFELDLADGEVRYKTSIDVTGGVDPVALRLTFWQAQQTLGRYLAGLRAVCEGAATPQAAIKAIEGE